uniref:Glutaredoxin domain-containing protein n=1 Tax=Timema shepardi TaxID=629360 RepID=A0A7R9AQA7_TIMSH|nr:unnamed protein product [Timema shepardi]
MLSSTTEDGEIEVRVSGYKEKEVGKVVLYSTTMGVVRKTYQDCVKVKKILRNMMVKYEERDVFMSREVQSEVRDRMNSDVILVPQMFVEGQHIGLANALVVSSSTAEDGEIEARISVG